MTTIRSDFASLARVGAAEALARSPRPAETRGAEAFGDFAAFDVSDDVKVFLPDQQGQVTPDVGHAARQVVMHLVDA